MGWSTETISSADQCLQLVIGAFSLPAGCGDTLAMYVTHTRAMNCAVLCGLVRVGAAYPKHSMRVVDYAVHFPTQTRPSYYYEKRFPILYISQYYIYRINFRQRGCNLDARNVISTKPRGPSIWAHAVVSTQVALHRSDLPYQHDEHELATIRNAAAEYDSAVALRNRELRRAP